MFRFGCGALPRDEQTQAAFYGARLIYNEVLEGFSGVVYDRQSPEGDSELIRERIFPHMDEFMALAREAMDSYAPVVGPRLKFDGNDVLCVQFGDDVVFAASPQGSYGYLYLSAVVLA